MAPSLAPSLLAPAPLPFLSPSSPPTAFLSHPLCHVQAFPSHSPFLLSRLPDLTVSSWDPSPDGVSWGVSQGTREKLPDSHAPVWTQALPQRTGTPSCFSSLLPSIKLLLYKSGPQSALRDGATLQMAPHPHPDSLHLSLKPLPSSPSVTRQVTEPPVRGAARGRW